MIISHTRKFIFAKTRKTAGTSIEIGLSQFCSGSDIITPLAKVDEELRESLGYRGPCNYLKPISKYNIKDVLIAIKEGRKRRFFHNHSSLHYIKESIDSACWHEYFKFAFVRDPFERLVSMYYWEKCTKKLPQSMTLKDYLESPFHLARLYKMWSFEIIEPNLGLPYNINYFKFEDLRSALCNIQQSLSLPLSINLPRTKHKQSKPVINLDFKSAKMNQVFYSSNSIFSRFYQSLH